MVSTRRTRAFNQMDFSGDQESDDEDYIHSTTSEASSSDDNEWIDDIENELSQIAEESSSQQTPGPSTPIKKLLALPAHLHDSVSPGASTLASSSSPARTVVGSPRGLATTKAPLRSPLFAEILATASLTRAEGSGINPPDFSSPLRRSRRHAAQRQSLDQTRSRTPVPLEQAKTLILVGERARSVDAVSGLLRSQSTVSDVFGGRRLSSPTPPGVRLSPRRYPSSLIVEASSSFQRSPAPSPSPSVSLPPFGTSTAREYQRRLHQLDRFSPATSTSTHENSRLRMSSIAPSECSIQCRAGSWFPEEVTRDRLLASPHPEFESRTAGPSATVPGGSPLRRTGAMYDIPIRGSPKRSASVFEDDLQHVVSFQNPIDLPSPSKRAKRT